MKFRHLCKFRRLYFGYVSRPAADAPVTLGHSRDCPPREIVRPVSPLSAPRVRFCNRQKNSRIVPYDSRKSLYDSGISPDSCTTRETYQRERPLKTYPCGLPPSSMKSRTVPSPRIQFPKNCRAPESGTISPTGTESRQAGGRCSATMTWEA